LAARLVGRRESGLDRVGVEVRVGLGVRVEVGVRGETAGLDLALALQHQVEEVVARRHAGAVVDRQLRTERRLPQRIEGDGWGTSSSSLGIGIGIGSGVGRTHAADAGGTCERGSRE